MCRPRQGGSRTCFGAVPVSRPLQGKTTLTAAITKASVVRTRVVSMKVWWYALAQVMADEGRAEFKDYNAIDKARLLRHMSLPKQFKLAVLNVTCL